MAELSRRHAPATVRLKELIATQLGRPKMLFCHHRQPQPSELTKRSMRTAGNDNWDLLEMVDWCRYVVNNEPTSVVSVRHADDCQDDNSDYQMMNLAFAGEKDSTTRAFAQISYGQYIPSSWQEAVAFRPPAALQVACERGIAFIDPPTNLVWFDEAGRHQEALDGERPVDESMLLQFHRSTMSLVRRMGSLDDITRALEIVDAAAESQQTGKRVKTNAN
jgi:predicted dehydrogenase